MKDYYQILGVNRDANEKALKSAYRKLANEWHPDKHQSAEEANRQEAENKFKEISEAYSVLSDPEKKANYDLTGDPNRSGGFKTTGDPFDLFRHFYYSSQQEPPTPRPSKGQSIKFLFELSLTEAIFGCEKEIEYSVNSPCGVCGTRGGTEFAQCDVCKGSGFIIQQGPNIIMQTICGNCRGQRQKVTKVCENCKGQGIFTEPKKLNVKVPAGLGTGSTLRLAGVGGQGFNGGPPGDVLLGIEVDFPPAEKFTEEEREQLIRLLSK